MKFSKAFSKSLPLKDFDSHYLVGKYNYIET